MFDDRSDVSGARPDMLAVGAALAFAAASAFARRSLASRASRPFGLASYFLRYPRTCSWRAGFRHGSQYLAPRSQGRQIRKPKPHLPHSIA